MKNQNYYSRTVRQKQWSLSYSPVRVLNEARTSPSEPKAFELALTRCLRGELGWKLAPMLILGCAGDGGVGG